MNPSTDSACATAEDVEGAAATWFWKKDRGEWTEHDQAGFEAWLNSSTAHRVTYLRLQAGWNGAERMKALGAGIPRGEIPPPGSWGNDRFLGGKHAGKQKPASVSSPGDENAGTGTCGRKPRFNSLRYALPMVAVVALGMTLYVQNPRVLWSSQYSTPIGGLDTVSLADGSRVTLNTDTRIVVDLGSKERRIDLKRGEAFFVVAKDAARPFVVYIDDKRVTAVGTQFSVRRDADDIQVVVTEGQVKLERGSSLPALEKLVGAPPLPATALAAGAIAHTSKSEVLVQEDSGPEAEQLLSWRSGYLVFEGTPLADAVAEFNRYNTRKIVITDPSLASLRIGGNFRANNTDAFLWLLEAGFHVQIEQREDHVQLVTR